MRRIVLFLFTAFFALPSYGTHLAGGTIEVVCVGGNQFRIRLVKYKDPLGNPMAPPFTVTVDPMGSGTNQTVAVTQISVIPSLPQPNTNPCLVPPPNSSLQEYIYQSGVIALASGTGYYLYHGDNARNSTNTLTGQSSMLLYAEFPDPGAYGCNNSPRFNENPPMAVCLNEPLSYDGSAVDPDGDVLQYRLCAALTYPPNNPPFNSAPYAGVFNPTYPVASNPPLAINLNTGLVTGTPNAIGGNNGRYIFNYCVDEYRSGVKIGQYNREVQMTVTSCTQAVSPNVGTHYTSIALGVDVIASCDDYTVKFNNTSIGGSTFFWDFGVPGINTDTSTQFAPTYTYPDTGTFTVKLVINKGFSCSDSITKTVIVYPVTSANFSHSTPACQAEPISFTDQSTMTYGFPIYWSWQFGNGGSSGQQNPNYVYNTPGNYNARLTFESSKGCRDTVYKLVQVASKPVVGGGGNKVICVGGSTVLNGSVSPPPPNSTVNWAPATGLSCTNCLQPTASPATNTIYTITATGPTGCTNQATVLVTVTPAPTVSAGPDKYLCGTGSTQLDGSVTNVTTGYSVSWSPTTALSPTPNILNPTASPTTTTTYVLTVNTTSGCVVKDTMTVHVNSLSVDLGPDTTICPGETVQFNAVSSTPGLNYSWQPSAGVSDPTIPNPTATPSTTTTYTVAAINPVSGCSGTDIIVVTVNTPPAVDAGSDTTICVNSSANLQGTGATSFVWDPDPTLSCTNCPNPTASPASTKKYYVTGYDAIGCENRDSMTVTVVPLPNATIAQAPSISICPGDSIQLTASGAGSGSYSWNPTNTLSCGTCSNPYAKPSNNTVYTVMVTDGNNCVNTATVQVNIEQKPAITINQSSPSICEGDTMQLTATPGLSSYSWKPPADIDNPNIPNPKVYPPNTRTYTVTGTNATGCSNTQTVTVTVNQLAPGAFIPDTAVCDGGSVQLYANGFTSWQWAPAASLDNPNIGTPTATPTSTTTYTVNVTDNNGCSDEGTVTVVVNPLPTVTVTNPTAICFGDSITLSATGGNDYQWTPVGSLDDPTSPTPEAKPNTTTPYTVTVTDGNGCVNTATTTITVNPLPAVTAGTDQIICEADTAFLDAGGADSYVWSGPNLSCTSCETPQATPALTTIYTVEGTDANGCKNTDEVQVTVNILQPGNFIPDTAICIGESIELFANGFDSYQWSPAGSLSNPNIRNPIATPTSTTTYEVAVEDVNGCQDTGMITVTVNPLPTPTIQVIDDSLCLGTVTTMSATSGMTSYNWTPGLGLSCNTCAAPSLTAQQSRIYTVEVEDANGCTNTATQSITVMPLPTISKSPDDYVCKYDSTQIWANGGVSYQWSPNYRMTCTTCEDPTVYPLQTTNYSVEVTDEYGCVNRDSIEISVNTASGNISPDTEICTGQSTQLTITGGVSYQWSPPGSLSNPNIGNPLATPTSTTEYSVTVQDQNGCRDTGYVTVTVNPLPNVNAGTDATICAGQSTNLNASGATNYSWSPPTGLSDPLIRNPVASPNSTTTYVVTGTDANNCTNTDQITVTVNPLPNTNAGADRNICFGEDTQLLASGADTYNWAPSTGLSCTNCPDPVASPTSTTTYTVTGILPTGCTKTDQVVITVNALPNVTVTKAVENICIGDNVQLSASGGSSYEWTPTMGLSDPNIANPVATPQQTTVYTVRAYNAANCYDETTVTINVASPATIDISADTAICPGETVVLTATGGATYSWSPVGQTGSSITVTPSQGTTYTVDIIDANNCEIQATVDVDIYVPADPMATGEVTICRGDTAVLSATNGVSYSWSPSVFNPNSPVTSVRPQSSTVYTVTIVDNNGCTNTDEVEIIVVQLPKVDAGPDISIYEGDRALLQVTGASTYLWSPPTWLENPTSNRTISAPEDTITYQVVGTDAYGCTNMDSITVFVLPKPTFYVPTGFSPNGDGQNDEFRIYYPSNFNLVSMRVYDRWGNLVFETKDMSKGWKGISPNGDRMPVGTYVYIIEAVDDIGFPISRTGNITLIR